MEQVIHEQSLPRVTPHGRVCRRRDDTGLGIELPFTMPAVVMAQVFVTGPFYIRGAKLGIASGIVFCLARAISAHRVTTRRTTPRSGFP